MQETYIKDIKKNKDVIVKEKEKTMMTMQKELGKKQSEKKTLEENQKSLFKSVTMTKSMLNQKTQN